MVLYCVFIVLVAAIVVVVYFATGGRENDGQEKAKQFGVRNYNQFGMRNSECGIKAKESINAYEKPDEALQREESIFKVRPEKQKKPVSPAEKDQKEEDWLEEFVADLQEPPGKHEATSKPVESGSSVQQQKLKKAEKAEKAEEIAENVRPPMVLIVLKAVFASTAVVTIITTIATIYVYIVRNS